jgi:hypothetical protein
MSTQDLFGAEIARLELALDRASDEAERILNALATEQRGITSTGEPNESILTRIDLLRRVTAGLRSVKSELQQSSAYPSLNLERELGIWERARDRFNEAKIVWDDLGTTLTEVTTAHLMDKHCLSGDKLITEWQQAFPTYSDAGIAIRIVNGYASGSQDSDGYAIEQSDKYLLQLRFMLGLTQSQIGKLTGVGQAAAASRLGRAIERLRPLVADQLLQNMASQESMNINKEYTDLPYLAIAKYRMSNLNNYIFDVTLFAVGQGVLAKNGEKAWLMAESGVFRDIRQSLIESREYVEVPVNGPPTFTLQDSHRARRVFGGSECYTNVVALYDPGLRSVVLVETGDFCEQTAYLCSLIDGQGTLWPSLEWGNAWNSNLPPTWLRAFNFSRYIDGFSELSRMQDYQEDPRYPTIDTAPYHY